MYTFSDRTGCLDTDEDKKIMRKYTCPTCLKCYSYYSGLYNHRRFECGKEPQFQCPYCPYKVKMKHNLKSHILSKHLNSVVTVTT